MRLKKRIKNGRKFSPNIFGNRGCSLNPGFRLSERAFSNKRLVFNLEHVYEMCVRLKPNSELLIVMDYESPFC